MTFSRALAMTTGMMRHKVLPLTTMAMAKNVSYPCYPSTALLQGVRIPPAAVAMKMRFFAAEASPDEMNSADEDHVHGADDVDHVLDGADNGDEVPLFQHYFHEPSIHSPTSRRTTPIPNKSLEQGKLQLQLRNDIQVATLTLDSSPTNGLTLETLKDMSSIIQSLDQDHPQIQGLVLKSNKPRIFCSGLHLKELHNPDPARLSECWHAFQQVFIDLYGSRLATVAAIDGHATAAGCSLALACDYRVMTASRNNAVHAGVIGLNETMFGMVPPFWMFDVYAKVTGFRNAEQAMTLGRLFSPEDALKYGLVDRLALVPHEHFRGNGTGFSSNGKSNSKASVVEQESVREIQRWLAHVDSDTRLQCRVSTRMPLLRELEHRREEDVQQFCGSVTSEKVQTKLSAYVKRLQARKSKTPRL